MKPNWVRPFFALAGAYDLLIGLAFLINGPRIFDMAAVPYPNHWGYIHFAALLLMVFGMMFFAVAAAPHTNRNLIPYGVLLKLSYVGVVGYYLATSGVPALFIPFAVADALMLPLFVIAFGALGRSSQVAS